MGLKAPEKGCLGLSRITQACPCKQRSPACSFSPGFASFTENWFSRMWGRVHLGLGLGLKFGFNKCRDGGWGGQAQVGIMGLLREGSLPRVQLSLCLSISPRL